MFVILDRCLHIQINVLQEVYQSFFLLLDPLCPSDNVARLTELMHDIQEFGQPPPELIKKLAPDLEFDQNGIPNMNGAGLGPMMNEECCIM